MMSPDTPEHVARLTPEDVARLRDDRRARSSLEIGAIIHVVRPLSADLLATMDDLAGGSASATVSPTGAGSSQAGSAAGAAKAGGGGGGAGSPTKTELSEVVTVSGSTMTTVITYTDGTTSTTTTTDANKARYERGGSRNSSLWSIYLLYADDRQGSARGSVRVAGTGSSASGLPRPVDGGGRL